MCYYGYSIRYLLEDSIVRRSLSFMLFIVLIFSCFSFVACARVCKEHNYELIESEESTCVEKGYDLYQCTNCKEIKREEKQLKLEHAYDTNATCVDRECVVVGCKHKEEAKAEHDYTKKYVCSVCGYKKDCSLEIIGNDYKEELLNRARLMAGSMTGNCEVVVLGKEETLLNIENYTFATMMDKTKIVGGLFVKFDVILYGENIEFTIYYNFGLQFSEEQKEDIGVTYDGSEIWYLEVVDGNETILFDYSIT